MSAPSPQLSRQSFPPPSRPTPPAPGPSPSSPSQSAPPSPPNRLAVVGLLGSTALAGLLFAPVFGLSALLAPVLVVVATTYLCVELSARVRALTPWRPLLVVVAGLLGLIESVLFHTTVSGLPTGASLDALWRGLTEGWLLTLQSTWPARPDPDQLLFVPLAVLLAALIGTEALLRLRTPLLALVPGIAIVVLSQAYQALTGWLALLAAAGYAALAALSLWAERAGTVGGGPRSTGRTVSWLAVPTALVVVAGAALVGVVDPMGRDPYTLRDGHEAALRDNRLSSPLDEVGQRLARPEREVFRYRADGPVDRWSLAVYDGFDGANWTVGTRLRRLGLRLNTVDGGATRTADVHLRDRTGPWLPSQSVPLGVDGPVSLVDQSAGTLLLDQPVAPGEDLRYRLTWSVPDADADTLVGAGVDTRAGGLGVLDSVPAEIEQLARSAVRFRPTFQSALALERFLAKNYQVAVGENLPTGHGWPQLRQFLVETKRGTSEQFAAAYVVLARLNGIPARLVVGYRGAAERDGDSFVVRDRDVLAWPEVSVAGVGWVPLDPTATAGASATAGAAPSGLAKAAAQARDQLPPDAQLRPPELPRPPEPVVDDAGSDGGSGVLWVIGAAALGLVLLCWLVGVPLVTLVRKRRRGRRTGSQGVIGAWAEACDRLRAHGVPYRIGMTPRDLAAATRSTVGDPASLPIVRLGRVLDMALWSGEPATSGAVRRAWAEVRVLRQELATRPFAARLRALFDPRPLIAPRQHTAPRRGPRLVGPRIQLSRVRRAGGSE